MIGYRFIRYIIFLTFIVLVGLFVTRKQVSIFPITGFFNEVVDFYTNIPSYYSDQEETSYVDQLSYNINRLITVPYKISQDFFDNISLSSALGHVLTRNFDDFEYLIQEYLIFDSNFKDIIVYHNNTIVYKYNNSYLPSSFIIEKEFFISEDTKVFVDILFDEEILQQNLRNINEQMNILYKGKILNSTIGVFSDQEKKEILESFTLYPNQNLIELSNNKKIHAFILEDQLKDPITIFVIERPSFNIGNVVQFFVLLLIPLLIIVLLVVDKRIQKYFAQKNDEKDQRAFLKKTVDYSEEGDEIEKSLLWFDQFVKLEGVVEKDIDQKEKIKQHNIKNKTE